MEKIIPISDLQSKAKQYVDQVKKTDEAVIITQRGRAAAVLVSYEEYEGSKITQDEMRYPDWKLRLRRAERESRQKKGLALDKYVQKKQLPSARPKAA